MRGPKREPIPEPDGSQGTEARTTAQGAAGRLARCLWGCRPVHASAWEHGTRVLDLRPAVRSPMAAIPYSHADDAHRMTGSSCLSIAPRGLNESRVGKVMCVPAPIDFWTQIDADVLRCLTERHGEMTRAEIGQVVGLSEQAVRSVVGMLAETGKVRITSVVITERDPGVHRDWTKAQ